MMMINTDMELLKFWRLASPRHAITWIISLLIIHIIGFVKLNLCEHNVHSIQNVTDKYISIANDINTHIL